MGEESIEKWEDHFEPKKREGREDRKRMARQDRSKFKKSDQKQRDKQVIDVLIDKEGVKGRVLSITAQGVVVEHENEKYICTIRGTLMQENNRMKNLVTVGDFVNFLKTDNGEGVITSVEPRKSVLSRADALGRRRQQLIAANIDQVLITVAVVKPLLKPFLVDRYIIAANRGNMKPVVVVNKIDLLDDGEIDRTIREQERSLLLEFTEAYDKAGIPVIALSASKGEGLDKLREAMKDKSSVFSGQSGVGKSSLINAMTGLDLKVGDIVEMTLKGSHTTSTAQLIPLQGGGFCIDTPGIKSFGLWDFSPEEVRDHFPEFVAVASECQFPNCSHIHEADCAVKKGVERGTISPLRYASYEWLLQSLQEEHKRR